jgi:hypothetical protein
MLPDGLTWIYLERFDQHWLTLDGEYIALVSKRVTGDWLVHVNRQRPFEMRVTGGAAATLAFAKKMAERWAMANLERVRREVAQRIAARPKHRV